MDIGSLCRTRVQDRELLDEFAEALNDRARNQTRRGPPAQGAPGQRHHRRAVPGGAQYQGRCCPLQIRPGVAIAHPIETMLSRFRDGEILSRACWPG